MDLYAGLAGAGATGASIPGPPWILGHRGTPREAPENTLVGLRRALEADLDGVEYDVRACGSGELVLMHDATLERTTDSEGPLAARDLRELFGIDAGSWFARRYVGESVPLLAEALELGTERRETAAPIHMIELKEPDLIERLSQELACLEPPANVRVACFRRDVVLAARDAGLPAMLLAVHADEDDRRFVRDERLAAYGVGPGGWRTPAGGEDWSFCELWAWSVDDPEDLLAACRRPLFGFNTNEPHRALATRALVHLAPDYTGPYPVEAPELYIEPESLDDDTRVRGEWFGSWNASARVHNPFPFAVEARASVFVPQGAFEIEGLPRAFDLEPGEARDLPFALSGGARSPGPDPLLGVLYTWRVGTGSSELSAGGQLLLDAPLVRRRLATADGLSRRLAMLPERAGDPPASVNARRQGGELLLSLENGGGLSDPHLIANLGGHLVRGGSGLRLQLPSDFDVRPIGVLFSCGIEGRDGGERRVRRWAGGIPEGLGHGRPGLLVPLGQG